MGKTHKGFSLIELMVVMTIIAILVTIALPRYRGSVDHAQLVALKSNLRVMREAIDRYHDDKARFPGSLQALVDEHYLNALPVDPITGSAQSWMTTEASGDADGGVADVHSGAKGSTAQGETYAEL